MKNTISDCEGTTDLTGCANTCEKMASEISEFLIANGGYNNGYETYAKGYIALNHTGTLDINVNNEDLSKKQLKNLALKLETKLKKLIPKKSVSPHFMFIVKSEHIEDGCFATYVSFDWGTQCKLY